jgi:hypothetical protein
MALTQDKRNTGQSGINGKQKSYNSGKKETGNKSSTAFILGPLSSSFKKPPNFRQTLLSIY